jgi:hypothetical protein
MMWVRTDVPGSEVVVFDDAAGLHARGWQHAEDPVPYALLYEVWTDSQWATTRLVAHTEGAGWSRDLDLARKEESWTTQTTAVGGSSLVAFDGGRLRPPAPPGIVTADTLRGVVDVDIGGSPLTNALPVHRLRLLDAPPGHVARLDSAWVLPPTLEVIASTQTYTVREGHRIRYGDATTGVDVQYDRDGWVEPYPGLANRVRTHNLPDGMG